MKRTPLALIFLIVFIDLLGFGIIIPILPSYAQRGFAADDITVGFLVASYSFMQLIFTPFMGRLSDNIGRKPVLLIGLLLTMSGYVLFAFANTLVLLFLSRLIAGIGGANISAAQAYIADVTTHEDRAKGMGMIGAAFGLGFVFGPFLGGFLSHYGYEVPGFFAAGLSFVSMLLTLILLPESRTASTTSSAGANIFNMKQLVEMLRRPRSGVLLILFFLVTFAYANIYATFPIISNREFGFSDAMVGGLFAFMGLIGALTQGFFIRYLTTRFSERALFLGGSVFTMIGLTLIPFYISAAVLLIILAVLSLGAGTTTPTSLSMISKSAGQHEQGALLGMNQSMGALARVLGPIWGGFTFQTFGHMWPFLTGGAVMFLAIVIVRRSLWN